MDLLAKKQPSDKLYISNSTRAIRMKNAINAALRHRPCFVKTACLFAVSSCHLVGSCENGKKFFLGKEVNGAPHVLQPRQLQQGKGTFVSFGILTYMGVGCSAYERQFSKATPFVIQDTIRLQAITRRLAALQPDTAHSEMDARAKAVFLHNDRTQDPLWMGPSVCIGAETSGLTRCSTNCWAFDRTSSIVQRKGPNGQRGGIMIPARLTETAAYKPPVTSRAVRRKCLGRSLRRTSGGMATPWA